MVKARKHCYGLWLIILALSLGHIWSASIRRPHPAAMGNEIHAPSQWQANDVKRLRISTYNIHRAKGLDGVRDIERTAALLEDADILGLNEVGGPSWFGTPDQAQQLGNLLDTGWLFAPVQTRYFRTYMGNALLSRIPIIEWHRQPLVWSDRPDDKDRSHALRNLLTARIDLAGKEATLLITHLDRGPIREQQLKFVLDSLRRQERAILLGDLNTRRTDPELSALISDSKYVDTISEALGETDEPRRIDWIIAKGFKVLDGGMEPAGASDHPYYWVDLELRD
ncbi:MAG: endonuclease/exonuclease/phosphatase family protein [Gammaproteobacteria bacterium]|nr:endonuclease/exonuclease/phosphatase family protein [Gammaproteobacteria bacterium]